MVHITAHSGCDGTPDNSLEFVRHALQTNADALEVDVRKTKDGILAISHDAILDGQDAPALDAVFALVAQTDKWINCDLKEPDLENAVIDLARGHGLLQRLIFSGTVSL
ncbi:MAG: glycerophosphodiester phosphodiesterase, partial [Butyricicoccus pullicaecorum]|nr:glycerophosphodiester phosphodiesterase [Butyricicoccus pullicaecorum]